MRYTYNELIDPRTGRGVFTERYEKLGEKGQAACDVRMMYLRDQPPQMWVDPHAKKLDWKIDDNCKGIYEIRFKAHDLQQRPMGYFGPNSGEFTIVIWVTHKGKQYSTSNFCEVARTRWDAVRGGTATIAAIEID